MAQQQSTIPLPNAVSSVTLIPTRLVGNGSQSILAGASVSWPGVVSRQQRVRFVVTNLDPTASNWLKIVDSRGQILTTAFPQVPIGIDSTDDISIYNPQGTPISYEFMEWYADTAFSHGLPQPARLAGGSGAGGSGSGTGSAGGGSTGSGSPGGGGTQTR